MTDVSTADSTGGLFNPHNAEAEYKQAFNECLLLRDARFSSDDRFYRTLVIGGKPVDLQFSLHNNPL